MFSATNTIIILRLGCCGDDGLSCPSSSRNPGEFFPNSVKGIPNETFCFKESFNSHKYRKYSSTRNAVISSHSSSKDTLKSVFNSSKIAHNDVLPGEQGSFKPHQRSISLRLTKRSKTGNKQWETWIHLALNGVSISQALSQEGSASRQKRRQEDWLYGPEETDGFRETASSRHDRNHTCESTEIMTSHAGPAQVP